MPYRDSIGQPAGYGSGSPHGLLRPEDLYDEAVLHEPVENPVADAEMGPPMMGEMPMGGMPMGEMGPEAGQFPMPEEMAGGQAVYPGTPMSPAEAGAMLRERLRKRQEQLSSSAMRFTDITHELNK